MRKLASVTASVILALAVSSPASAADPIRAAAEALVAINLTSLRVGGLGANFSVGQSPSPGEPWPRVTIKSYAAAIATTFRACAWRWCASRAPFRHEGRRSFTGERRFIEFVSGSYACVAHGASSPPDKGATPPLRRRPAPPRFVEQPPQPLPAVATKPLLQIWLTPHGFPKAALANKAATRRVDDGTEVSFTVDGRHRITGSSTT